MYPNPKVFLQVIIVGVIIGVYCEFIHYYVVLYQCDWPKLTQETEEIGINRTDEAPIRAMVLADTHLIGFRTGYWIDRVRREWQMYRAFQTAIYLHRPEIVFVLGDLLDEGQYCGPQEFQQHVERFRKLFRVPNDVRMYTIVGNHDIGFHYRITPYINERFLDAFNSTGVQLVSIRGVHFVMVNSMALEGDGCFLCHKAELKLAQIKRILNCAAGTGPCSSHIKLKSHSRPILMQHFPLYRISDEDCHEPDEAPVPEKYKKYKEGWDCISKSATHQLLEQIQPRLVLDGHSHNGCTRNLSRGNGIELTIPSFNWRNKDNPSFSLMLFSANNYAVYKCMMPVESTVMAIYFLGLLLIILRIVFSIYRLRKRQKYKYL